MSESITIDTPEGIRFYQLLAARGRLKLELHGFRFKGRALLPFCREMGWTTARTKAAALVDLNAAIEAAQVARQAEREAGA